MINKNLARRLERLEDEVLPAGEEQVVVIHVQGVDRDGQVVSTLDFRVVMPPSPPKRTR
jgi:hypothetical protein